MGSLSCKKKNYSDFTLGLLGLKENYLFDRIWFRLGNAEGPYRSQVYGEKVELESTTC